MANVRPAAISPTNTAERPLNAFQITSSAMTSAVPTV